MLTPHQEIMEDFEASTTSVCTYKFIEKVTVDDVSTLVPNNHR